MHAADYHDDEVNDDDNEDDDDDWKHYQCQSLVRLPRNKKEEEEYCL